MIRARWSLHTTLDLGSAISVVGGASAAAACVPFFAAFGKPTFVASRFRAMIQSKD